MDKDKLIATLKKYEEKLAEKDFDLEAWKSSAVSFIARTFGAQNTKTQQLESLKIDYSSWALRDAPSTYHPLESCKRKAKEIIQAAIDEIDVFGIPQPPALRTVLSGVYSKDELEAIATSTSDKIRLKQVLDKTAKGKNLQALLEVLTHYPMD